MPLFFIIAIGCGAFTMGAVTVDATSDIHSQNTSPPAAQSVQAPAPAPAFQAGAYATTTDCLNAAALQGAPASACRKS